MASVKSIKLELKEAYRYIRDDIDLEWVLLNCLIMGSLIYGKIGYYSGLLIFLGVVIIKLFSKNLINSIFTLKLALESEKNKMYLVFVFLNLFMGMLLIQIDYSGFASFLVLVVIRIVLGIENMYTQNLILTDLIEDLYNWGEISEVPSLASKKTVESSKFLKSIKEQIRESVEKQMETEYLKTELITNISHDLKTPLTSIVNYTDILGKKDVMDEEAREYVKVLGRNSERLKNLVIDLIYASKTGSGDVKVEKGFIDFNELVSQIYGDFDEVLKRKNVEFIYNYGDREISLYSDGNILSRIIQNLISNAYKYSKEGTQIIANAECTDEYIFFSMENISNTEIKLSEKDLFNELVKSEKSRNTEGSGLGLYIAKNLTEILGGNLFLKMEDNVFKVYLKLKRDLS
ncbi:Signal transduction histidine kinase [Anaerosphaera aminiphila DSM 21120]|uniref:histidine kinase n=1 Tax=Anaerosphaera aminiphila DSM 21120 TaxID=1120995 RepID=A0A1M5QEE9_9FIRM|nr:HAMP domain-containing sensor histidine kinase [Anaerosphaera aminiphila]SHH12427.1 Signal transduction histidine kinase [Anaerosphaera aminiphila DSM 21120]